MNSSGVEICSNCGCGIPKSEQAHVFKGEIVCAECDRKLRSRSVLRSVASVKSQCGSPRSLIYEQKKVVLKSHAGKKIILLLSIAGVFALAICIVLYFLPSDIKQPASSRISAMVTEPETAKAEPPRWPFDAQIPEGFEFDRQEEWKGRTFWVLKGKQFGQAHEILVVVMATPETLTDDVLRVPYWAAELSVDVPVGESMLSQRLGLKGHTTYTWRAHDYGEGDPILLICPKPKSHLNGLGGDLPIPIDGLGKPEDFAPRSLYALGGLCKGTLLLVAYAGKSYGDSYLPLKLLLSLRQEQRFKASDLLRGNLRFDDVIPNGYVFKKRIPPVGEEQISRLLDTNNPYNRFIITTLWIFAGEKFEEVQETVVVVSWGRYGSGSFESNLASEPLTALTNCARWAAEISLGKPKSKLFVGFGELSDMIPVVKDARGEYKLSNEFQKMSEDFKKGKVSVSGSFDLKNLLAIGESTEGIPRLSFEKAGEGTDRQPTQVCTISRAVPVNSEGGGFVVFAGATIGTPDAFWRMTRTVDKIVDDWVEHVKSQVLPPANSELEALLKRSQPNEPTSGKD